METVSLPEYYTTTELQAMSADELRAAQANGFRKDLQVEYRTSLPATPAQDVRPAAEVWGSTEYDFVCPSGAKCRMRKLMPEMLIEHGILDRITVLPGIAAEVVEKAEGLPPKPQGAAAGMPSKEDLQTVRDILEILVPLAVAEPRVYAVPVADADGKVPDRVPGRIYTDSIELFDRIAIMERAVQGVNTLQSFRAGSGESV